MNSPTTNQQIIFVDDSVQDYQNLIQGADTNAKIIILDDKSSGIAQITQALADRKDIKALHILSHGSQGSVKLGTETLNQNNLENFNTQLKQWGTALTQNADILLYGCEVAKGETGKNFLKRLSEIAGADIAASANLTGSAELGGDWNLEVQTGPIETPIAFNPKALKTYSGVLGLATKVDFTTGTNPYSVSIGDINGDGLPDLAVANYNSNTASILLNTTPKVTAVTATTADGSYGIGSTIAITVTFDAAVNVTDIPQLQLETGTTDRFATYASGSGSTTLTFNYAVQAGDTSADLEYLATNALTLNGGTIKETVGTAFDAILTLPTLATANSLGGSKAIVIDGVAPTITNVTSTTTDGSYGTSGNINVTVNFSEAVTLAGGNMTVALDTGGTVTIAPFTGTSAVGAYTPATGQNSTDLNSTTVTLATGATLTDTVGNNATLTIPAGQSLADSKALVVDTIVPTVTLTLTSPTTTNAPFNVTATFSENVTGFSASDVSLTNSTIGNFTGSGTTYTFTVNPAADGTVTVDVPSAVATDTAITTLLQQF